MRRFPRFVFGFQVLCRRLLGMVKWIVLSQGNQRDGEGRHKMHCPKNQKEIQIVMSFVAILP